MFFHITLERAVQLHPRAFGPNLRHTLIQKLHSEVEGTCSGRYGFIIMVTSIEKVGLGKITEGTAMVTFPVTYKAIVFRPFRNEVLDAVVTNVNKMGFMAEAGPLQIFVSKHLIPADMTFDAEESCYSSSDGSDQISKDDEVRLKIVGSRVDATEIFAVGSIKDDYLGRIA
eukprot:TRINITY_DN7835_c0_g1_i1.p1 TRINITY_DN7835_c0_g1~~TRINITY_DN7835_c0_g1_i1.p1  ORF type:complete len:171 (-),score=25.13 TRINITY_DN7835_c0_g1_i1:32-544(-)